MGTSRSQARLRFSERRAELESKLGKVTLPQKEKKKKRRVFEKTGRGDVVYGSTKNREWA